MLTTPSVPSSELFPKLGDAANQAATGDEDDAPMQSIESLCMRCHDQGITRLLLTTIPYFKEIIVSSFHCDHCGFRDTEIQSAGEIQRE
jgi:zinc finger protein